MAFRTVSNLMLLYNLLTGCISIAIGNNMFLLLLSIYCWQNALYLVKAMGKAQGIC